MPRRVVSVFILASMLVLASAGTAFAAPTWLEAKNLSAVGFGAFGPRVGLDANGGAVTSWFGATSMTGDTTQVSERTRGGGWSAPKNLQVDGTNTPDLAVSPDGTAVIAWEFDDVPGSEDGSYIETSVRTNGVWSPAAPLPKDKTLQFSYFPRVAMDTAGDAVVVWQECYSPAEKEPCFENKEPAEYAIRAAVRMAGGGWSTPKDVTTGTTENAKKLSAAINPSGDIAVAWEDMKGNRARVSLLRAGAPEPVVHTLSTKVSGSPQVAFAADGTAIAVWDENDAGFWVSSSTAAPGSSSWSASQHLSGGTQDAFQPDLAVAPGGEAVAVWETLGANENSLVGVQGAIMSGGVWLPAQNLSPEAASKKVPRLPRVAMNAAGAAIVAWQVPSGSNFLVEGNARQAGGSWAEPKALSSVFVDRMEPAVAIDPEGNGVVAWRAAKTLGVDERIQAIGFDAAGPRLDGLTIPASGTPGQSLGFSVAPSDAWSALAGTSWNFGDGSTGQGTNVTHAYGQPGTYQVTVSGTDALGNVGSATGSVTVTGGQGNPTPGGNSGDQSPPANQQPPHTGTNPPRAINGVARLLGAATVRNGKAVLVLRCSRAGGCSGLAKLVFQRTNVIGKSRFKISAGGSRTLRIKLGPAALSLLEESRGQQIEVRLEGRGVKAQKVVLGL